MKFVIPQQFINGCTILGVAIAIMGIAQITSSVTWQIFFAVAAIVYAFISIIAFFQKS